MFERRLQEIRRQLEKSHLDAILISHLPHVRYLTGFSGSNGFCIVSRRRAHFLTDPRYRDQSRSEVRSFSIHVSRKTFPQVAHAFQLLRGVGRVGFEGHHVSVASLDLWKRLFKKVRFVPAPPIVEQTAARKEEFEIVILREATSITDRVFRALLRVIKAGVSELDISAEISYWNKRYGADGDAFDPIVASGPRGALPHGRASARKIRKGEFVTLDFGSLLRGYHSDMTRTVAVGNPSARMKRIYRTVLCAQEAAIEGAAEGVRASKLDRIARTIIRKGGYGRYFTHSLGHGLGIEIHEPLRLSAQSEEVLVAGHVVTVEPGVYIPGYAGVRIEDDIVIRQNGCEVLNRAPKQLIVL